MEEFWLFCTIRTGQESDWPLFGHLLGSHPCKIFSGRCKVRALVAAETRNPCKVYLEFYELPWVRVVLFCFFGAFCVSMFVPSNKSRLGSSSTAFASLYNDATKFHHACILTSVLSAGVADIPASVRNLHGRQCYGS